MRRYFHRASACASQLRHYFGSSLLRVGHAHSWSARDSFSRSANVFSEGARTARDGSDASRDDWGSARLADSIKKT
jgi:hypothetical protein